jgi:protein TonB
MDSRKHGISTKVHLCFARLLRKMVYLQTMMHIKKSLVISIAVHAMVMVPVGIRVFNAQKKVNFSLNNSNKTALRTVIRFKAPAKEQPKVMKKKVVKKAKKLAPKKVAKKAPEQAPDQSLKKVVKKTLGQSSAKARYLSIVRSMIAANKKYPYIARRLRQQGTVKVYFEIAYPNKIKNIKLQEASRYDSLNRSALAAVKGLKSLPSVPAELKNETLEIQLPIVYESL